ncbi:MAG: CDP-alcohol phosphatidyltransferase family protein [Armatimonadetes bacterium]|nr:CDP-alcohol phosphatidyltransferase family protein [Armatimonadota bacterium]
MIDRALRDVKDACLQPVARRMSSVSPNAITLVGFTLGLATAGFAAGGHFHMAVGLWLASRICDGLDGAVARAHGRQTDFGGYLDLLLDLVVYAAIPIGIAAWRPDTLVLFTLAVLLASFYVNLGSWLCLSAILEKRGRHDEQTTITMPGGLIEGAETILFYCAFLLWPAHAATLFAVMAIGVLIGAAQRLIWASRSLR